jgi:hypothetical protein
MGCYSNADANVFSSLYDVLMFSSTTLAAEEPDWPTLPVSVTVASCGEPSEILRRQSSARYSLRNWKQNRSNSTILLILFYKVAKLNAVSVADDDQAAQLASAQRLMRCGLFRGTLFQKFCWSWILCGQLLCWIRMPLLPADDDASSTSRLFALCDYVTDVAKSTDVVIGKPSNCRQLHDSLENATDLVCAVSRRLEASVRSNIWCAGVA